MLIRPILKLDSLLARFWGLVLSLLCAVTGRSNFFFARIAASLGFVFMMIGACVNIVWAELAESAIATAMVVGGINVFYFGFLKLLTRAERWMERNPSVVPFTPQEKLNATAFRLLTMFFAGLTAAAASWYYCGGSLCIAAALYFMLDLRPKQKSQVKKLIEAVKQKLASIKLPSTEPHPSPG